LRWYEGLISATFATNTGDVKSKNISPESATGEASGSLVNMRRNYSGLRVREFRVQEIQ